MKGIVAWDWAGLQPWGCLGFETWGVAPGWDKNGPSALETGESCKLYEGRVGSYGPSALGRVAYERRGPKAHSIPAWGNAPGPWFTNTREG